MLERLKNKFSGQTNNTGGKKGKKKGEGSGDAPRNTSIEDGREYKLVSLLVSLSFRE